MVAARAARLRVSQYSARTPGKQRVAAQGHTQCLEVCGGPRHVLAKQAQYDAPGGLAANSQVHEHLVCYFRRRLLSPSPVHSSCKLFCGGEAYISPDSCRISARCLGLQTVRNTFLRTEVCYVVITQSWFKHKSTGKLQQKGGRSCHHRTKVQRRMQ